MAEVAIRNIAPSSVERVLVFMAVLGVFSATAVAVLFVGRPPVWSAGGFDMDLPYGLLNNAARGKIRVGESRSPVWSE
jgi:hypothetical protein